MMKKAWALFLVLILCFSLCACGHEHKFGEWSVTKEATCTEIGFKVRTCECGEEETEEIEAIGHAFKETSEIKTVTCEEDGEYEMTCDVCGLVENKIVSATGHDFEPATNFKPKTCTLCGATEGEALAKVITVGDTVETEEHSFVVKKIKFTGSLSESRGWITYNYHDGYFLAIKLDFTNLSTDVFEDWGSNRVTDVKLEYKDKYNYEGEYWIPVDDIVPLDNDTLYIVYEVPKSMGEDDSSPIYATFTIDDEAYAVIVNDGTEN